MRNDSNRGTPPRRQVNIDTTRAHRNPRSTSRSVGEMNVADAYRGTSRNAQPGRTQTTRTNAQSAARNGAPKTRRTSSAAPNQQVRRQPPVTKQPQRRKKKSGARRVLMTLLVIFVLLPATAFGAFYFYINHTLSGDKSGMGIISDLVNTPKEYKGDVVNFLVCGIDYEDGRTHALTDMIMYVNFDVKNKKINMLQIPRDTYVGGDLSANGKINGVASHGGGMDISALANQINKMFKLPIDYYLTIDMQSLRSIVDTFGGIEVYVPRDMEFNGSKLSQGYQTMDGAAAEFFVRNRHGDGYATGDFARLEMQRYFYSGLFNRLRTMTPKDIFKLFPVFLTYMKTDMDVMDMASIGVSALQVPSQNIMMCRLPEYGGAQYYKENAVTVVAEEETAELLNTYFRAYGEPVSADQFEIEQWPHNGQLYDAAINFMGQVDAEAGITSGNIQTESESEPAA